MKENKLIIETQSRDDHQITLIVEIETVQMEGAKHRAARRISEWKKIPGFRPGKAPYDVVLRSIGEAAIVEDAVDLLLDELYPKAIEEAKLQPGASGSLEKVENLDSKPRFTFTVPLAPSVSLGDYHAIRLPYEWEEPSDSKVEESLQELRQIHAKTESVDRPIQKGDFVMIDLKGVDEKATEETTPLMDRPGLPVFIRPEENPDEFPFSGFSNELVGLNTGESKSFIHEYNQDSSDESLRGKNVQFTIRVKMVRGSILPELDDDFAKKVGPFENLQSLRQAVKANLSSQSKANYDDDYFTNLLEKIKESAEIKYPPQVVDHEVTHVMEDLKSRLAAQNLDMASYLKSREMDEEKFLLEEARPIAIKRLERSLLMDELAKAEKIEVNKDLLQSTFQQTLGEYQYELNAKKLPRAKSLPSKQVMNAVAMESANRVYVQQTLERLKEIATGQVPEAIDGSLPVTEELKTDTKQVASSKKGSSRNVSGSRKTVSSVKRKNSATVKKSTNDKEVS